MNNIIKTIRWDNHTLLVPTRALEESDFDFDKVEYDGTPDAEISGRGVNRANVGCFMQATPKASLLKEMDELFLSATNVSRFRSSHPFRHVISGFVDPGYRSWDTDKQVAYLKKNRQVMKMKSHDWYTVTATAERVDTFRGCRTYESRLRKLDRVHKEMLAKYAAQGGDEGARQRCLQRAQSALDRYVAEVNYTTEANLHRMVSQDAQLNPEWIKETEANHEDIATLRAELQKIEASVMTLNNIAAGMRKELRKRLNEEVRTTLDITMPEEFKALLDKAFHQQEVRS